MKKLALLTTIISFIGFSCDKNEEEILLTICDGKRLEDMQWFRDIEDGKTECTVYPLAILTQHQHNGREVFRLSNSASSLGICTNILYDCFGEIISSEWTDKQWSDFIEQHPNGKVVWIKSN